MSQVSRLKELLEQKGAVRTDEILRVIYGGEHKGLARPGARIDDLKRMGYRIVGWHDKEIKTLYWYAIIDSRWADRFLFLEDILGGDTEEAYRQAKEEFNKEEDGRRLTKVETPRETIKLI